MESTTTVAVIHNYKKKMQNIWKLIQFLSPITNWSNIIAKQQETIKKEEEEAVKP